MADVNKTIEILFAGADEVSGTIATITGNLDDLAGGVKDVSQPFADLADNILKLDAVLTAFAVGGLAYAFIKSAEFEGAVIELQKVIGEEIALLGVAKDAALDLSDQYGESSADILLSTANFKQAGFDVEEAMLLTKSAMDLSIAGSIEAAASSEILISILKGFKVPATEAARAVDILNEVSNNYATNVQELGIGMAQLSPIANLMGFSFEETAGILTPVIEIFRSGNEAAVALKTGLLKLIDDSKPVSDALASIGVAQRDVNGDLRSGKDILYDVATAFQTAEENDKLFLAAQLVGIRQAGKMVEVFDGLAKSTEITSVAMGAAGSAALEVAARLQSSEVAVDRFKVGFENLGIIVGDQFRLAATEAIDGATDIELALQDMVSDGTFDSVFDALNTFGGSLGEYLQGIAIAMPEAFKNIDWSELLESFSGLGDSIEGIFTALFGDLDLTKADDLQIMIQKIVDSVTLLTNVSSSIIESLTPLAGKIGEIIDSFVNSDEDMQAFIGSVLGIGKAVNVLATAAGVVTGPLDALANGFVTLAAIKYVGISSGVSAVGSSLLGMVTGAQAATGSLIAFSAQATLLQKVGFVGMAASFGWMTGKLINEYVPGVKEAAYSLAEWTDKVFDWTGTQDIQNQLIKDADQAAKDLTLTFHKVPPNIAIALTVDSAAAAEVQRILDEIPEIKDVKVTASGDITSFEQAYNELHGIVPDEKDVNAKAKVDSNALAAAAKKIDEAIPTEKVIEITLQGEIDKELANIAANAELMQSAVEWTAKLNIAEVEANMEIITSAFTSIDNTISSTGDVLASVFGMLDQDLDLQSKWAILDQIRIENKLRKEAWIMQEKLLKSQKDYNEARTWKLYQGDQTINIKGEGLQPHMKAFMWEILSMIQVRANAESAEFLLGI